VCPFLYVWIRLSGSDCINGYPQGISQSLIIARIGLSSYMRGRGSASKHTAIAFANTGAGVFASDSAADAATQLVVKLGDVEIPLDAMRAPT
jgi:hypothetical protein